MLRISNIKLKAGIIGMDEKTLKSKVSKILRVDENKIHNFAIAKKSIDARDKTDIKYIYSIDLSIDNEDRYLGIKNVAKLKIEPYIITKSSKKLSKRPLIVGSGPAGIFAGLTLAKAGLEPIIIEQGKEVSKRIEDVSLFWKDGVLNSQSNVQFGEGGAGTFSDGKLTTGIKDIRIQFIFDELIYAGAPKEIKYANKPHIGTDKLVEVIKNLRQEIISLGGEYRFENKFTDPIISEGKLQGAEVLCPSGKYILETNNVILALGHSARDTFEMLYSKEIKMVQKPFAVGLRIEHKREMIDKSQFGKFAGKLPAAGYKLSEHLSNGRGVYTFCMCPGGYVVGASSEEGHLAINGMSYHSRNFENSNAAILVSVGPEDFGSDHPLSGINFQRRIEVGAYNLGGGSYCAPIQLVGDFLKGETSKQLGEVIPTYKPGVTLTNLDECLDSFITDSLREGLLRFEKKLNGFTTYDAVLTAVESRSSSPVRILRSEMLEASIQGIYPCGEGAGYAGGIISSAVDGVRCGEKIIEKALRG